MTSEQTLAIEVLICAYNDSIKQVLNRLPASSDGVGFLVSHQISNETLAVDYEADHSSLTARNDVQVFATIGSGLSNNRNNALEKSSGKLLLISDDDVEYESGWADSIKKAFSEQSHSDVITFRVNTPEGEPFKNYPSASMLHSKLSLFRVSSIEVVVKRAALVLSEVRFDSNYGLNAKYQACEETVFLSDLRKKNLTLTTSDKVIAIHPKESSGSDYSAASSCIVRGAVIRRVFGLVGLPLVLAFSIKHYPEYKTSHSFVKFLQMAMRGFFSSDA